jgi:hypothetical protein
MDRCWVCNTTQFKSAPFRRWRDASTWKRYTIFPCDTPTGRTDCKRMRCSWSPLERRWFIDSTAASADELNPWHRARLTPPPQHVLSTTFELRALMKHHGARWDAAGKRWVLRAHAVPRPLKRFLRPLETLPTSASALALSAPATRPVLGQVVLPL